MQVACAAARARLESKEEVIVAADRCEVALADARRALVTGAVAVDGDEGGHAAAVGRAEEALLSEEAVLAAVKLASASAEQVASARLARLLEEADSCAAAAQRHHDDAETHRNASHTATRESTEDATRRVRRHTPSSLLFSLERRRCVPFRFFY